MPEFYYNTKNSVRSAVRSINDRMAEDLKKPLCVDLEFNSHSKELPLSLVQVAVDDNVYVLDAVTVLKAVTSIGMPRSLAQMLRDPDIAVVMHGAHSDSDVLNKIGIRLNCLFDTQIAHEVLTGERRKGLSDVLKHWLKIVVVKNSPEMKEFMRTPHAWMKRPLPSFVVDYAAEDVAHLPRLYAEMCAEATRRGVLDKIFEDSEKVTKPASKSSSARDSCIAFAKELMSNVNLRSECEERTQFSLAWNGWKRAELQAGRVRKGSPGDALFTLLKLPGALRAKHGLPRVVVRQNMVIIMTDGSKGSPSVQAADTARRVEQERTRVEADKSGVVVSKVAFEEVVGAGSVVATVVAVSNTPGSPPVSLLSAKLLLGKPNCEPFRLNGLDSVRFPIVLAPGQTFEFQVLAQPVVSGMSRDILSLFFSSGGQQTFSIGRYLDVRCGDAALLDMLKPVSPYVRQRRRRGPRDTVNLRDVVRAPASRGPKRSGPKLENYDLFFSDIPRMLAKGHADDVLATGGSQMTCFRAGIEDDVVRSVYREHQHGLLYAEEVQLIEDLSNFDLVDDRATVLTKQGGLLKLKVPGLAEKRPSVLKGDKVLVKLANGSSDGKFFEGVAERIEQEEVGLKFHSSFYAGYITGQRVEVKFVLSRKPLRLFHQGVEGVAGIAPAMLFPEPSDLATAGGVGGTPRPLDASARPFNRNLNEAQRGAVQAIVRGEAKNVPYVLFGPPGTGKTTTVVEAVLQCAKYLPSALGKPFHILLCAPTNTAVDFVSSKLAKTLCSKKELLRFVAYSRTLSDLPRELVSPQNLTNWNSSSGTFETPTLEELCTPIVVATSLCKAGDLVNEGVPRGHFDLVVVDESGQAIEQEAMAAIGCLLGPNGQLCLAGDPKQLGPVVHHHVAKENGLGTSYLERIMDRPLYQRNPATGQYDRRVLTKLVENYRSHEALLRLPNRLFYEGDLVSRVDPHIGDSCLDWEGLPVTGGMPILWHGVQGKDSREAKSPSWFNPDEATQVLSFVQDLLAMRRNAPKPEDIGVISPYNKQVQKINMTLRSRGIDGVKVGSTEVFQGQERRVIILSTVRSSPAWVDFDLKHNLGFLDNPKRFNVATTRAQALLIVVGNPFVLAGDTNWRELLKYCVSNGAYTGVPLPVDFLRDDGNVGGTGGGGGDDDIQGVGASADEVDSLTHEFEELLLGDGPSQRLLQEGMEMPSHE